MTARARVRIDYVPAGMEVNIRGFVLPVVSREERGRLVTLDYLGQRIVFTRKEAGVCRR